MIIVDDKIEKRHKRGDVREDGKIFWGRVHKSDCWLSKEKFDQYKQKEKEAAQRNYIKNLEYRAKKMSDWYKENKGRHIAASMDWVKKNPDGRKAIYKRYYRKNKEKVESANKKWRSENPLRVKAISRNINANRRAMLKACKQPTKQQKKTIECFYEQAQRLEKKLGIKFHVDHIVPIARGGSHIPTNLQVLPAALNVRKHATLIYKWADEQSL
jgi:5-methylcytosine-specific restriction endonuclease McrA